MLFSSITFLYVFLPIVCILYLISKKELHNPILLIASIIFYAWGEPKYLAIMLVTIILNYYGAILVDKFKYNPRLKLTALWVTIIGNLSFLFYFKYFDFTIKTINSIFHSNIDLINIVMPIGISFYTFQAMSYLIDVYRNETKVQKDFYKLALYITLFPQLVAGPIVKYHDVNEQIDNREVTFDKVSYGTKRFIIGLSKKIIIANTLGAVADKIFTTAPDTFSTPIAWLGAVCYSFQLFFDFSGYSDMAIGLGAIFGFKFLENFNYPYISKSITEFWRRWHISLSSWFRDYVYISLGGNRVAPIKVLRNLGIVFLLTGIWHGAAWNFVVWGLWHGFFIILEKILKWGRKDEILKGKKLILRHIYTIFVFLIGWVMFRSDDMSYAFKYIKNMFGLLKTEPIYQTGYYFDRFEIIILFVAILCSIPIFSNVLEIQKKNKIVKFVLNVWLIFLLLFSTMFVANSTYNPFIYFRF